MRDNRSLVLLTIYFNYIAAEHTISSNGWVPIARDQVYNQMQRKWTQNVFYPHKSLTVTSNEIKLINEEQYQEKGKVITENYDIIDDSNLYNQAKIHEHVIDKTNKNITNTADTQRKAKKINQLIDETIKKSDVTDDINFEKTENIITKEISNEIIALDRSNTYEVTEDTYNLQNTEQTNTKEQVGYDYTPPNPETQNLTSTLLSILSKYNINTDDKLLNYDLSRRVRTQTPVANYPTAWRPYRYNNLNHLAADPLLAVFLSNYGIYLPSLYGIKSNYNNLYGYLASNNIHNNRPFGLYKIFSDTDSWN